MPRRRLRFRRHRRGGFLGRYLATGEHPILVTRQHPFALVRALRDTLGLVAPLLLAAWGIAGVELLRGPVGTWAVRSCFLATFALVARLAWHVLAWEFERVVVTGEKVIHVEGVLHRRIASTPIAKVSEFSVRQPPLGRIFDYGSLVVDVPGGRDQALHGLGFIPDPAGTYRLISDVARGRVAADVAVRMPVPTRRDLDAIEAAPGPARPDPWRPTLDGDDADHTIAIPRIPPR